MWPVRLLPMTFPPLSTFQSLHVRPGKAAPTKQRSHLAGRNPRKPAPQSLAFRPGALAGSGAAGCSIVIHANAPGNRVEPRQHRLTGPIGMPHLVNAKPGFLQQVIRVGVTCRLRNKESLQLWAQPINENRGSIKVALLILGHESIEIAVRRHAMDRLPAILIDFSRFAQTALRNPRVRLLSIFKADELNSLECDRKLRRQSKIPDLPVQDLFIFDGFGNAP